MAIRYLSGVNIDSNTLFVDDANNRVGIGTGSPTAKLQLYGSGLVEANVTSTNDQALLYLQGTFGQVANNAGDFYITNSAPSSSLILRTADTERMRITSAGNVGIGMTSPNSKLVIARDVTDNDLSQFGYVQLKLIGATANAKQLLFGFETENNYGFIQTLQDGASWSTYNLALQWKGGNVGIGTKSPGYKLHVKDSTNVGTIAIGHDLYPGLLYSNAGTGEFRIDNRASSAAGYITFYPNGEAGTIGSEAMRITTAGNVGIGTTSPAGSLDIYGTTGLKVRIGYFTDQGADDPTLRMFDGKGTRPSYSFTSDNTSGMFGGSGFVAFSTSASERMRITSAGNVGIGTTSPATRLDLGSTQGGGIQFLYDSSQVYRNGIYNYWNSGTDTRMDFNIGRTANVAPVTVMSVGYAGNVGIGTTSPTEILELSTTTDPKIRFVDVGNTDAKIGIVGSTALGFEVNGSERMRIASTGATRLNAYGSGSFTGTVAYNLAVDSSGNIIETAGGVVDGSGTANYVSKWSDANTLTNSLLYDNGSTISIGLGSTTPSYTNAYGYPQFAIESNAFASSHVFTHNDTNGNYSFFALGKSKGTAAAPTIVENSETIGDFQFWAYDGAAYRNTAFIRNQIDGEPGAGDVPGRLVFGTTNDGSSSASEKMRITAAGNVGIGTTAPESKLHVVYGAGEAGLLSRGPSGDTWFPYTNGQNYVRGVTNFDNASVYFTGGNVGIGTTSPASIGTGVTSLDIQGSNAGGIAFGPSGTKNYIYGASTMYVEAHTTAVFSTSGTEKMRITSAGNVGIGTTSPSVKLHIVGSSTTELRIQNSDANNNYGFIKYETSVASTGGNIVIGTNASGGGYGAISFSNGNNVEFVGNGDIYLVKSGNVGIGTYSPAYKLDVTGTARVTSTLLGGGRISAATEYRLNDNSYSRVAIIDGGGAFAGGYNFNINSGTPQHDSTGAVSAYYYNSAGYISFYTNSSQSAGTAASERVRITAAGDVGIGTTAPGSRLDVKSPTGDGVDIFRVLSATTGSSVFRVYATTGVGGGLASVFDQTGTEKVRLYSTGDSYFNGGNVGIGTTAPNTKLRIQESGTNPPLSIQNTNADGYSGAWIYNSAGTLVGHFGWANGSTTPLSDKMYFGSIAAKDVVFTSSDAERMRITSAGNVGIGTTSPAVRLDVVGANSTEGQLYVGNTNVEYSAGINFTTSGTNRGFVGWRHTYSTAPFNLTGIHLFNTDNSNIVFGTNNVVRAVIDTNGNVGIGTTSPTAKLHVQGTSYFFDQSIFSDKVGIGTTSPAKILTIAASSQTWAGAPQVAFYDTVSGEADARNWTVGAISTNYGNFTIASSTAAGGDPTTPRLTINKDGNVGIGTTSPREKIDVDGNIVTTWGNDRFVGLQYQQGADYRNGLLLHGDNRATGILAKGGSGSNPYIWFGGGVGTTSEWARIDKDGNVGIGTTSPSTKLQVKGGDILIDAGQWIKGVYSTETIYRPLFGIASDRNTTIIRAADNDAPDGVDIQQYDGTSIAYFKQGGNVGIGTASPTARLSLGAASQGYRVTWDNYSNVFSEYSSGDLWLSSNFYGNLGSSGFVTSSTASFGAAGIAVSGTGGGLNGVIKFFVDNAASKTAGDPFTPSERMRITGGGNVGIGTTSPAYKLSVVGESNFSENIYIGNGSSYGVWTDTAGVRRNGIYLNTSSGYLGIRSGTSSTGEQDRIVINQSTGNVGIGTTSPSYALSVVRNANDWIGQYKNYGSIAYGLQIDLSGSTGATGGYVIGAYSQTGTGFFLKNDGTVGIGTTSPATKLHVIGTESRFGGVASGYISVYNANSRSGYLQANEGSDFRIASDTNDMTFYVNGSERVRFTAGGNVGIGTTSPTEKLHVDGSALVTYNNSYQSTNSTGNKAILARVSPTSGIVNYAEYATVTNLNGFVIGSDDAQVKGVYASDKLEFITNTATRMAITSGGNVGIGTASPTNILHITGVMRMDNVSANDPTLTNNATPKHGYGDVANEIYLAEPAAWFKINVEGTDYIIPAYLESV